MLLLASEQHLAPLLRAELFYDFLAAALMTIGLLSTGAALLRRNRDLLLAYFGIFASVYGLRLGLERELIHGLFDIRFYAPAYALLTLLVPLSLLLFFAKAGMIGRAAKIAGYLFLAILFLIFLATLLFGRSPWMTPVNNVATIIAITVFIGSAWQHRKSEDLRYAAWGFAVFILSVFCDNIAGLIQSPVHIEPLGMLVFLIALGYVSFHRALRREEKLISLEGELELARRIQRSILPTKGPSSPFFAVAARYVPMTDVAGDFYDYVIDEQHHLAILIADVSGHGIPASLIASMVKMAAASHRSEAANPASALTKMNQSLCGNTQTQFVTAGLLYLDAENHLIRYAAAAHPPLLRLRDGLATEVEENGLMLAAFGSAEYQVTQLPLVPGDRYLMYTDGLLEAADAKEEFFGMDRLKSALVSTGSYDLDRAADSILQSVKNWYATQDDDLTLILCEYRDLGK